VYEEPISRVDFGSPLKRRVTETTTYSPLSRRKSITREEEDDYGLKREIIESRYGDSVYTVNRVERSPGKYRREEVDRFGNKTVVTTRYY